MEIKRIDLDSENNILIPTPAPQTPKKKFVTPLLVLLAIILGVSSGGILKTIISKTSLGNLSSKVKAPGENGSIRAGDIFGAKDQSSFLDEAVGILEAGGIDGEGTHKLIRPGGKDQTAYLTSSVLDLDQFIGLKINVWGETFSAQKAGWLMDVGRVKVEELNPTPLEE